MIRLHDTAAGAVLPLEPRDPGKVSMYVCGPTVYGPPHLGHGRFSLVFDVLRRYLEWSGLRRHLRVEHHRHRRQDHRARPATRAGTWQDITAKCEAVWYRGDGRARREASGPRPPRHRLRRTRWSQLIERARRRRAGVRDERRRLPVGRAGRRLRPAGPPVPRRHAAGGGDGRSSTRARSVIPPTSCCGRWRSRTSRRGPRRGVTAGRAGTPSAS